MLFVLDDKRISRANSLSPSFTQKHSPEMRQKPKRNFIKNIRPDTFKRPSSFNLKDAETAAANARKDVILVGYRKTVASPNVHSRVIENELELGTFSPMSASSFSPQVPISMSNSVSLPVLARSEWGRNSDGTLPEYMQVARRSLRAKKKHKKSSIITVDFLGGSDPDISLEESSEENELPRRLKRAFTDPVRFSSKVRNKHSEADEDNSVTNVKGEETCINSDIGGTESANSQSISRDNVKHDEPDKLKKHLDFQEDMYKNLSYCLTQAIGDEELHDSDKSDDETFIQNGYDEFLEEELTSRTQQATDDGHTSSQINCQDCTSNTPPDRVTNKPNSNTTGVSLPEQQSGLTVRDILKLNALQLTAPGATGKTDNPTNSRPGLTHNTDFQVSMNGDTDAQLDVLSGSKVNVAMGSNSNGHSISRPNLTGSTDSGVTGSQSTLASKDSSVIEITLEHDQCSDNDAEVTVIELLREEYKRNPEIRGPDFETSISDFSDSGVSIMSHKNFKASSESNLLQSVDTLRVTDTSKDAKSPDLMVTSASFPDITKISEAAKDGPKLVDRVGRSTVK